jgi:hypothetical protein
MSLILVQMGCHGIILLGYCGYLAFQKVALGLQDFPVDDILLLHRLGVLFKVLDISNLFQLFGDRVLLYMEIFQLYSEFRFKLVYFVQINQATVAICMIKILIKIYQQLVSLGLHLSPVPSCVDS